VQAPDTWEFLLPVNWLPATASLRVKKLYLETCNLAMTGQATGMGNRKRRATTPGFL